MNFADKNLKDFIFVDRSVLPSQLCDFIIKKSDDYEWQKHGWYGHNNKLHVSKDESYTFLEGDDKEFDRTTIDKIISLQLKPYLQKSVKSYTKSLEITVPINFYSHISLNRYNVGSRMKNHYDHIHSLFDGKDKGIPVLSIVGLLNDDFEGGDFIFWENYNLNLKKGDILIFPSLFFYSHNVQEILRGTRYSIVCWSW